MLEINEASPRKNKGRKEKRGRKREKRKKEKGRKKQKMKEGPGQVQPQQTLVLPSGFSRSTTILISHISFGSVP